MPATRCSLAWPEGVRVTAVMLRRKAVFTLSTCRVALGGALILAGACRSLAQTPTPAPGTVHPTLAGRVMVGYQGWFRAQGDQSGQGWRHYSVSQDEFKLDTLAIDYWPDVSDPLIENRYEATNFKLPGGSAALVFSSHDPATILAHFKWMQQWGIHGAFVQRFAVAVTPASNADREATDAVLLRALEAARSTGRSVALMYDLSGLDANSMGLVIADWKHVVDVLGDVRQQPAYQWHQNRPVVAVYGVGFREGDDRKYTVAETKQFIDVLKGTDRYGSNTVMAGVAYGWEAALALSSGPALDPGATLIRHDEAKDASLDRGLLPLLEQVDIICPWTPGRYKDMGEARWHLEKRTPKELLWCLQRAKDYLPVVFPGFSYRNLADRHNLQEKGRTSVVDREDGRFLWEQYRSLGEQFRAFGEKYRSYGQRYGALAETGCTMVYQAMFDEMDEGTQIFKVAAMPPENARLLSYPARLPTDYYLRLVGRAAEFIQNRVPFPLHIPEFTNAADAGAINEYLRLHDKEKYDAAERSYQSNKRMDEIAARVAAYAPNAQNGWTTQWTPVDAAGTRILVFGSKWNARHTNSSDPNAFVTWEFNPSESGIRTLEIRHPGDRYNENSTGAVLQVAEGRSNQPTSLIPQPIRINLQKDTERWNRIADINVTAGVPVRVSLGLPMPGLISTPPTIENTGRLVMFEPRLVTPPAPPPQILQIRLQAN